jgi:membrane-anchored mycosin MYCP
MSRPKGTRALTGTLDDESCGVSGPAVLSGPAVIRTAVIRTAVIRTAVIRTAVIRTAVITLSLALSPVAPAGASVLGTPTNPCLATSQVHTGGTPWALRRLAPQRTWPLSRGQGVLVAVIGTGIDASNTQFADGQVRPGRNLLAGGGPADTDCDGSGTFVAGLIAARPDPRTSVVGVAPAAELLPVRVTQAQANRTAAADPDVLAAGIRYAVGQGAKVLVVYAAAAAGSPGLRAAVASAVQQNVIVISGGQPDRTARSGQAAGQYPCGYPEVVGVAGVGREETPIDGSCTGPDVDLAAPGAGLISTAAGTRGRLGHVTLGDQAPGLATGYVAGAAALVLRYEPRLTAAQVTDRLTGTATRPASGTRDDQLGWGMVDPYAAVARPPSGRGLASRAQDGPEPFRAAAAITRSPDRRALLLALSLAGAGVGLPAIMLTCRRAGRRRWRPARRALEGAPGQGPVATTASSRPGRGQSRIEP